MLVLKNHEGAHVVVLDQADIERMKSKPLGTPDGLLLIGFSPDLAWTSAAFTEASEQGTLTPQKIAAILATVLVRPAPGEGG